MEKTNMTISPWENMKTPPKIGISEQKLYRQFMSNASTLVFNCKGKNFQKNGNLNGCHNQTTFSLPQIHQNLQQQKFHNFYLQLDYLRGCLLKKLRFQRLISQSLGTIFRFSLRWQVECKDYCLQ